MNRTLHSSVRVKKRADRAQDNSTPRADGDRMSKADKLALLTEIERIINSQHVTALQKIERLREAIASDN